LNLFGKIRWKK
jgi:hypothetical protein